MAGAFRLLGVRTVLCPRSGHIEPFAESAAPWRRRIVQMALRVPHALAVQTDGWRDFYVERFGAPVDRTHVVENWTLTPQLRSRRVPSVPAQPAPDGGPELMYAAALEPAKGIDDVLEMLPEILPDLVERGARFTFVGDGSRREAIQVLVEEHAPYVAWRAPMDHGEFLPLLSRTDVLVAPSRVEGLPNLLVEAASLGTAIIAAPVGGIPDFIVDDVSGLLVEAGRPDGLAAATRRLVADEPLRRRLAAAAWREADRRFDVTTNAARLSALATSRDPVPPPRSLLAARTARHLPPRQAATWVRRRLAPDRRRPRVTVDVVPPGEAWDRIAAAARRLEPTGPNTAPAIAAAEAALDHRYEFVGTERRLEAIDWDRDFVTPLWTYHLHYLETGVDLALAWRETGEPAFRRRCIDLWTSWLDAFEAGSSRVAPYPAAVRSMNGLRTLWLLERDESDIESAGFSDRLRRAVHAELCWLSRNLERHLRANHLQKDLTALAWGHLAFGGAEASGWRRYLDELWGELEEQVLPDGGHYERSPMYHAAALGDFCRTLALCRAAGDSPPTWIHERLARMADALRLLSRPDGTLHRFNDAANGERPGRSAVLDIAAHVLVREDAEPDGHFVLPDTGYFGFIDRAAGRRLVVDAGPLGPTYQPGHAHCDMLSFEFDLAGRPVVVDSGVHGYDGDRYREYARSTRAHNTVAIDGGEQHEMWGTFRVARRGVITSATSVPLDGGVRVEAACRPYHDAVLEHRRRFELQGETLVVTDEVDGARGRSIQSWLHLHPEFKVRREDDAFFAESGTSPPVRLRIRPWGGDDVVIRRGESAPRQGWVFPTFGRALEAPVLELRIDASDGGTFGWRIEREVEGS